MKANKDTINNTAEIAEITNQFISNPLLWGMWYTPHHFRFKSAPYHLQILKAAQVHQFLVIAAPRGSSKSTLLEFLTPLHKIIFRKKRFIVVISNTYKKASTALDNMKKEIKDQPRIKQDYNILITRDAEGDSIFRWGDGFETRVLCKGADQIGSLRGEKFGAYRPDLIILDDVEDDEMVRNSERRIELQELFDQVLMFLGDSMTQIIVIGTILHDDSLLAKLVNKDNYKQFKKLFYQGRTTDKKGNPCSLWEQKWTLGDLKALEQADPVAFAKEIQNDPVSGLMEKFKKEDLRYWTIDNQIAILFGREGEVVSKFALSDCKAGIACDLAWAEKRESDFTAIIPGFLTPNCDLLVDDYICEKGMKPDAIEEILFSMEQRLRAITGSAVPIGFEKAQLEKVIKWLLGQAMRKRNHYLLLKDLMWDADKITRIVTRLQPRYAQHAIYHKRGMGELEHQLLRIPSGTHDDLVDCLQGLVQLLEYPKQKKKVIKDDELFDKLRKFAKDGNKAFKINDNQKFVFGKPHYTELPARVSPLG